MSEEPQPSASQRAAGSDRRSTVPLRVVPDPNSPEGRAEALASAWARGTEQDDWCVDASVALASGCTSSDSGVAAMSASERRAIHLARQGVRARAILAATEAGTEHERRERTRRWAIVIGSAVLHAVGFITLATAVADLQPKSRPATHEHLFEARAVVPIEPAPASIAPAKPEAQVEETPVATAEPRSTSKREHKPSKPADAQPSDAQARSSEPYELRGFELSSADGLASGSDGERWGGGGGSGSGDGLGDEPASHEPAATKPDVVASPRGGLLEPEYPPELERKGVEGSVLVKVWIDEHGHVIKAEVVESSGEESFDHNAIMTAQRQEWTAALRGGEAVSSTRRYRVHFRLR